MWNKCHKIIVFLGMITIFHWILNICTDRSRIMPQTLIASVIQVVLACHCKWGGKHFDSRWSVVDAVCQPVRSAVLCLFVTRPRMMVCYCVWWSPALSTRHWPCSVFDVHWCLMFHAIYVAIVPVLKCICVLFGISLIQDVAQIISFSVLDRYLPYYF